MNRKRDDSNLIGVHQKRCESLFYHRTSTKRREVGNGLATFTELENLYTHPVKEIKSLW